MSDVITKAQPITAPTAAPGRPDGLQERRRPGRIENASPELIALMRKPTPAAVHQIMLYDAPNFVLPQQPDATEISLRKMMHFAAAFGICALGWVAAFKLMMMNWG